MRPLAQGACWSCVHRSVPHSMFRPDPKLPSTAIDRDAAQRSTSTLRPRSRESRFGRSGYRAPSRARYPFRSRARTSSGRARSPRRFASRCHSRARAPASPSPSRCMPPPVSASVTSPGDLRGRRRPLPRTTSCDLARNADPFSAKGARRPITMTLSSHVVVRLWRR